MKKALSKIGSVFLAIMVLFSTFSFTVEKHFCGGELADYSFVGNLDRCIMPLSAHGDFEKTLLNKVPCCKDSSEMIEGTNDELSVVKEISVEKIQVLAAFVYGYLYLFEDFQKHNVPFQNYVPPLVVKDITILYDTFLI